MLLHVVDASDPFVHERIAVVENILDKIGAHQPQQLVFNKIDMINADRRSFLAKEYASYNPLFVSALDGTGLEQLKHDIVMRV